MNCQVGRSQAEQGLIVSVLRNGRGDCSRGGPTADHQDLTVVNIGGPFGPRDERPAVMLVEGPGREPNPILVPAVEDDAGEWTPAPGWWMFGGNYASGDSRFCEAVARLGGTPGMAAKVHDRIEAPDVKVSTTGSDGAPVVIGIVRRRGMTWFALDQLGEQLSQHTSEDDAAQAIEVAAGVQK
jgi:hypothetical protein